MQKLLIYICLIFFSTRCAQITPLTGGKKDSTPPEVLKYYPDNASLNFTSKTIEVQFNEYITVKDIANQFIITPQLKELPDIQSNGKKLKITFNETLLPNTTYKLSFGNAITDLNEANVLQNFEYIFSTGPTIDSLKLSGRVLNSIDLKPVPEALLGLYHMNTHDSVIYNDKPLYIAKSANDGSFKFKYLPNSLFRIAAIKDQNKNLVYDGSEEQIAFVKDLVKPGDSTFISLILFKEIPSKNFIKRSFSSEYGKAYIIYNKPQMDIKNIVAKGLLDYTSNRSKDTITLYYSHKYDTLETFVHYESRKADTLYIKINSKESFDKQIKNKALKYTLKPDFDQALPFFKMPGFDVNMLFDFRNLKEDKITLIEKTDSNNRKIPFTIIKNSEKPTSFKIRAEYKPETNYTLTINKGFIDNEGQRINDSISFQFKTTVVDDYAKLKMKLFFPKKENYIIMLLNDKEQVIDERRVELSLTSTAEKIIEYENLIPGNYLFRIVEDANKNGVFDMGNYFLKQQPEIIFINSTPIKLLAGWEIENEWIVK